MNISQSTVDDIKKLSAEDLTTIGTLHHAENKTNEFICPFDKSKDFFQYYSPNIKKKLELTIDLSHHHFILLITIS